MPFDKLKYPEELWEERRKGVAESLRPISIKELVVTLKHHEEEWKGFVNSLGPSPFVAHWAAAA